MMELSGDSVEYELLTEAVELSAQVEGICIEIGLRRGLGTKTIIDAVRQYCHEKTVIAVDPYGSILYQPGEHMEPCRLDYTNQMKDETLAALWEYVAQSGNPVDFHYYCMTDDRYMEKFADGIETYSLEPKLLTAYSMVHLDGPHSVIAVNKEVDWFADRMIKGATLVIDDITPDFIPIEKVEKHMGDRFECLKKGVKKGIWVRK